MLEVLPALLAFLLCLLLTPLLADFMRKHGITGLDVHKPPPKPVVPEMCGIAMVISLLCSLGLSAFLFPQYSDIFVAIALSTVIVALIGLVDDLYCLNPIFKACLPALGGIPILLLSAYSPRPYLPFVGRARLTYIYPFIIPVAIAVTSNATNMYDVLNGSMPGSMGITCFFLAICSILLGRIEGLIIFLCLSASFFGFYHYNRYPASAFSGDVGSLGMGAAFGAAVITTRLDIIGVVAFMPYIMNGFWILTSVKGLRERREIRHRPVVFQDGFLIDSANPHAPITLVRLLVCESPLTESEVVKRMMVLSALAGLLAILTTFLILA